MTRLKDMNKGYSKDNVQELRFCQVIWGIISSALTISNDYLSPS